MTALPAPVEFRLRARWVMDTVEEANGALDAEKTAADDRARALEVVTAAIMELIGPFEERWREFLDVLESTGMPGPLVRVVLGHSRTIISGGEELVGILSRHGSGGSLGELEALGRRLSDIKRAATAVESATRFPEFDPERIRQRLEEINPDDCEDIEDVIARVKAGAPI